MRTCLTVVLFILMAVLPTQTSAGIGAYGLAPVPPTRPAPTPATANPDPTPPLLKNLGVTFGDWGPSTNRAGDFVFLASEQKVFVEFGARVSDGSGGYKYLHEFTYKLVPSANVIAAIDGIITAIRYQAETNDYEFDVRPASNSEWTVNYDHVQDLTISEGSQVRAGDILGKPQNWGDPFISRVELALLRDVGPFRLPSYRYCPFAAFDPGLVNEYKQKVTKLMDDWETFKGDNSIYDESQFTYAPGCTSENVVQSYGSYLPMVTKEYQP